MLIIEAKPGILFIAETLHENNSGDPRFLNNIIISDESTFILMWLCKSSQLRDLVQRAILGTK